MWRIVFCVTVASLASASIVNPYPKGRSVCKDDAGKPLVLTPYLKNNMADEGRNDAVVPPLLPGVKSYSGFFTVNEKHGSNMFFWFFPAENNPEKAPVVLWLQGGPGASSLYGTFTENGPFVLIDGPEVKLGRNSYYWSQELNVIYIDNPVGTGFSYTNSPDGYAVTETDVGRDLYSAVLQFFQLFPEYKDNDFFITGESYAGKYVPALAYTIHQNNPNAALQINLKGVAIGDGWVDPLNMIDYATYIYNIGLIDIETKQKFTKLENQIKSNIKKKNYEKAFQQLDVYFDGDLSGPSLFTNITGFTNYYNYLINEGTAVDTRLYRYLDNVDVRRKIHVGNLTFNGDNNDVEKNLSTDEVISIVPWLEVVADNYKVLLYNGQLDIICAYPLTMNYVHKMKWSGVAEYKKATRKQWMVGGELAGYAKTAGNFTDLLVRNAGHMVPADQPLWALDMITRFTQNIPFDKPL